MADAHIIIGNTASLAKDKKRHNWMLYVRGATQYVESVTIRLHPTFKNPVRTCEEAPFEFKSRGWGTFDIIVLVKWKDGSTLRTTWELQLDSPDASTQIPVPPNVQHPVSEREPLLAAPATGVSAATLAAAAAPLEAATVEEKGSDVELVDMLGDRGFAGVDAEEVELAEPAILNSTAAAAPADFDTPGEPPPLLRDTSVGSSDDDPSRATICQRLRETPFQKHDDALFMHGRGYSGPRRAPKVLWRSGKPPRKDHECPKWLTASEFQDVPEVATAKVKELATLMRLSRKTVAYTGAGISASVIGQAALSGQNKVGWKTDTRAAPPTFTHHALGFLGREGLLHGWVQQNHDGLPQKAGFPQERINEIHGSWFDPSNPVVKYSGTLHDRSYPWMREDADTADLCLVLGTSLGGLNADQVATKTAERTLLLPAPPPGVLAPGAWIMRGRRKGLVTAVTEANLEVRFRVSGGDSDDEDSEEEDDRLLDPVTVRNDDRLFKLVPSAAGGLGTVIMNLQQTAQDGKMTLRLFGKSDEIMQMLLPDLGFSLSIVRPPVWPRVSRALVPYDASGRRLTLPGKRMWLDLSKGQNVRITPGHNIQGAKQPQYMHIGAKKPVTIKGESRAPGVGLGTVVRRNDETCSFMLQIEGVQMRLGIWWLESAMRGGVDVLPIVNTEPRYED